MDYIVTFFPYFRKRVAEEVTSADGAVVGLLADSMLRAAFPAPPDLSRSVFARHICPVQAEGELPPGKDAALTAISGAAESVADIKGGTGFCVQCRVFGLDTGGVKEDCFSAKDVEVKVGRHFDAAGCVPIFDDRNISSGGVTVISVVVVGRRFFVGVSPASDNISPTADEYRVLSRAGEREISRAENKLKEAINRFGLNWSGGSALDIGAAPGGWSKALADAGMTVTAVDPADLSPLLSNDSRITHIKRKIEDVTFDEPFDALVCDMNVDPAVTAGLVDSLAEYVKSGAFCVVTIKLPFSDITRQLNEATGILSRCYDIIAVKNLTHNRREVTAVVKKL